MSSSSPPSSPPAPASARTHQALRPHGRPSAWSLCLLVSLVFLFGFLLLARPASGLQGINQPVIWSVQSPATSTIGLSVNITITGLNFIYLPCSGSSPYATVLWDNSAQGYGWSTMPLNTTVFNSSYLVAGPIPPGTGAPRIAVSVCGQTSLPLPRFSTDMLFWAGPSPPQAAPACTLMSANTESAWVQNYLCSSDSRALLANGTVQPIFQWLAANVTTSKPNFRCTEIVNSAQPAFSQTKKFICVPNASPYYLTWSQTGAIAGSQCVSFQLTNSVAWNSANYQLCAQYGVSPYVAGDLYQQYHYNAPTINTATPTAGSTYSAGCQTRETPARGDASTRTAGTG